jgi:hypothetical protein
MRKKRKMMKKNEVKVEEEASFGQILNARGEN